MKYRKDIDGLRAIAVIPVILFHYFPGIMKGGFVGVDIFFVISGYLITSITLATEDKFLFLDFVYRRVIRIFPALIVVIASSVIAGHYILYSSEYSLLGKHAFSSSLFTINFQLYQESGYFDIEAYVKPLLHLWSLAVEWQFYLLWPIVLIVSLKRFIDIKPLTIILIIISFIINIILTTYDNFAAFYLPFSRIWELLLGSLLAQINYNESNLTKERSVKKKNYEELFRHSMSIVGILVIVIFSISFSKINNFPGVYALLPTLASVLIIWSGSKSWVNNKILSKNILVHIGKISYPLYLWHWPLLSFAKIIANSNVTYNFRILLILISFILAKFTYSFIEKPIQNLNKRKTVVVLLLIIHVIIGSFGFLIYTNDGYKNRDKYNGLLQKGLNTANTKLYSHLIPCSEVSALISTSLTEHCYSKSKKPQVAIVGDSHAVATGYSAINIYNLNAIFMSSKGALPFYNYVSYNVLRDRKEDKISSFQEMVKNIRILSHMESIEYIILNSRGPMYLEGKGFGIEITEKINVNYILEHHTNDAAIDNWYNVFMDEYTSIINYAHSLGKKVIFLIDVPELGFNPKYCFYRVVGTPKLDPKQCSVNKDIFDKRNALYHKMAYELQHKNPGLIILNPTNLFCDQTRCYSIKNNTLLYNDDDHLNNFGGNLLAKKITEFLENESPNKMIHK